MHLQTNEMSRRIGNDVPLASLDLLARIITARTATFRGFYRLTVDDTCGRARLPTLVLARHDDERVVDRQPRPITRPRVKIPLHGRVRWKLFWKLPPLATHRLTPSILAKPIGSQPAEITQLFLSQPLS